MEAFVVAGTVAGFVAGARGAIGTYKGEEMATMEASIITAMVVGFVARAGEAVGTCKGEEVATV